MKITDVRTHLIDQYMFVQVDTSETDRDPCSGSGSSDHYDISGILAGGFCTAKPSDCNKNPAVCCSKHVFSLFCKESFYRIWNCTLFMEQYLYYDRIHRSYTGSGLSGCFQL